MLNNAFIGGSLDVVAGVGIAIWAWGGLTADAEPPPKESKLHAFPVRGLTKEAPGCCTGSGSWSWSLVGADSLIKPTGDTISSIMLIACATWSARALLRLISVAFV